MDTQNLIDSIPAITGIVLGLVTPALRPYVHGIFSRYYHEKGEPIVKQYTNNSMYLLSLISVNAVVFVAYSSILQVAARQGNLSSALIGYFVLIAITLGITIPLPFRVSPINYYGNKRYIFVRLFVRLMGPAIAITALLITIFIST